MQTALNLSEGEEMLKMVETIVDKMVTIQVINLFVIILNFSKQICITALQRWLTLILF